MKVSTFKGFHKTSRALFTRLASDNRLSSAELRLLLLALARELFPGDSVELGRLTTAKEMGCYSRTCERARQALVKHGYLLEAGKGLRGATLFKILTVGESTSGEMTAGDIAGGEDAGGSVGGQTGDTGDIHIIGNKKQLLYTAVPSTSTPTVAKQTITFEDGSFSIPSVMRHAWANAYPGVDISREVGKAYAWCVSNPSRAPKKDYARFLNAWLSRCKPPDIPPDPDYYEASPQDVAIMLQIEREIAAGKDAYA